MLLANTSVIQCGNGEHSHEKMRIKRIRGNHQSNLCPYVFVYCCYYLLLNEGNHTVFGLLPLTYFTLRYTLNVHPCCHKWLDFVVSYGWVVFHCVYIPHFLYLFVPWWALRLLPSLGYCEWRCNEHRGACTFTNWCFQVLWINTQQWNSWIDPWFFEKSPYCFP